MPADQAAGLRRRNARQPLRCIHCFFDQAESTTRLAQALYQHGRSVLLLDASGRMFADASPRSLFDWKQQLQCGQLHTVPLAYGAGWYAPGVQADEPALCAVAHTYDDVLFDVGLGDPALMPGASQGVVLEVNASHESMLRAYARFKTLSHASGDLSVALLGDPSACDQVKAACSRFLDPLVERSIYSVAHEVDAFAALAVRMACEEASQQARYKTGQSETWP